MKEIVVSPSESGQRFDKFLIKYLPNAGRSFLYKMFRKKNITINGKKPVGNEMLSSGDVIKIFFSDETFEKFRGDSDIALQLPDYKLDIIYEDKDIIIANKPSGVLSQKAKLDDVSYNDLIVDYIKKTSRDISKFRAFTPSIANRLDRNTSGIIVAGKTLEGLQSLSKALKEREIDKYYLAICFGVVDEDISFNGYLLKDHGTNTVSVSKEDNGGDNIITLISPICSIDGYSLVKVKLITGKTHQIRATLSHLGLPIVGDSKYGSSKCIGAKRQMLHAYEIVYLGNSYFADIPDDFKFIMDKIGLNIEGYGND